METLPNGNKRGKCKSCDFNKLCEHKRGSTCTSGDKFLWAKLKVEMDNEKIMKTTTAGATTNSTTTPSSILATSDQLPAGISMFSSSAASTTISSLSTFNNNSSSNSSAIVQLHQSSSILEDNENIITEENNQNIYERGVHRSKRSIARYMDDITQSEINTRRVKEAKLAIKILASSDVVANVKQIAKRDEFKQTVNSDQYWKNLDELDKVLSYPTNLIGKMKGDDVNIATAKR